MTTPPAFWQRCLEAFSAELTPQQFGTWIRPLVLEDTGSGFRLLAPNRFVLQWVKERFAGRIAELAELTEGRPVDITLGVAPAGARPPAAAAATEAPAVRAAFAPVAVPGPRERAGGQGPFPARRHESSSLNPDMSFANFVSGKANQLARAAAMQVAGAPTSYNPLFVYGGVGLGKTHLIQAIGNDILGRDPAAKIRYIHAEQLRLRRRARLPAQVLRRLQALLPFARPAADRRHPVLQRQEPHPGGVLLRSSTRWSRPTSRS